MLCSFAFQIDTSGDDKTNNALRLLTRYEFLNAVVRIAKARAPAQFNAEPAQCVRRNALCVALRVEATDAQ